MSPTPSFVLQKSPFGFGEVRIGSGVWPGAPHVHPRLQQEPASGLEELSPCPCHCWVTARWWLRSALGGLAPFRLKSLFSGAWKGKGGEELKTLLGGQLPAYLLPAWGTAGPAAAWRCNRAFGDGSHHCSVCTVPGNWGWGGAIGVWKGGACTGGRVQGFAVIPCTFSDA